MNNEQYVLLLTLQLISNALCTKCRYILCHEFLF